MPDEIKKQSWYDKQTNRVKRLTVWFAFIIAFSTLWGVLKLAGMDLLNITVGCTSVASQTEQNTKDIEKIVVADSVNDFWKGRRRQRDSTIVGKRLQKIENKLHIQTDQ